LLCLVARARPFGDDVLLGLGVGSKGECDTGEGGALFVLESAGAPHAGFGLLRGTYKVDTDN
jgi:hypothetical protein